MTITEQLTVNGCPCYNLKSYNNIYIRGEEDEILPYISQDITERIKTFEDAYKWCRGNGNIFLCSQYERILELSLISIDLLAYLKLRIITCALNEGWEPTFDLDEPRWLVKTEGDEIRICYEQGYNNTFVSGRMFFKTGKLAQYAAEQFRDIYADFCGIKKGGEK